MLRRIRPSRITQILNLRNLAPVLQERILELAAHAGEEQKLTERALRQLRDDPKPESAGRRRN
jgi:hypothetical protein